MRIRSKVSFEAHKKCMTIKELIIFAILKAYQTHQYQGDIPESTKYSTEENKLFLEYIGNEINTLTYSKQELRKEDIQREREEKGLMVKGKTQSMLEIK